MAKQLGATDLYARSEGVSKHSLHNLFVVHDGIDSDAVADEGSPTICTASRRLVVNPYRGREFAFDRLFEITLGPNREFVVRQLSG